MIENDNPYDLLAAEDDDHRWAFGTGFTDPLAGVDVTVPDGVDAAALAQYCLMLGDDALILSHRLQEHVGRLPELEEETAVANIALDLLGQARMLLSRAASADPSLCAGQDRAGQDRAGQDRAGQDRAGQDRAGQNGADEDRLAFFRSEGQFRNVRLVERADADFAELVGRLLVFSTWRLALFEQLAVGADQVLAAICAKGVNELAYHRDYAAGWVVRLGDGTDVSRQRMQQALTVIWPLVPELFASHPVEQRLPGIATDAGSLRPVFDAVLDQVLAAAALDRPDAAPLAAIRGRQGRDGVHTEALGYVLAELQSVARAHPDATW
jgi:ring-1,2-phenylacetyl-CoA epoxidase subunit PaaC